MEALKFIKYRLQNCNKSNIKAFTKILLSIISFDQSGFMKNRYVGQNVRHIFDIIDYANEKNIHGLILFADFEKAFDSLNHCYLFKCLNLEAFEYNWYNFFYNDISSVIIKMVICLNSS